MKTSTSISTELFKEKIDQFDQTIKFCNFKISKGKDMSVSEIIEMKKIGDPNLSSLIEVLVPIYVIEPHPAAPERDFLIRKHRHKRDKIRH